MIKVEVDSLLHRHRLEPSFWLPMDDPDGLGELCFDQEEHMHVKLIRVFSIAFFQGRSVLAWHVPVPQVLYKRLDCFLVGFNLGRSDEAEMIKLGCLVRMGFEHSFGRLELPKAEPVQAIVLLGTRYRGGRFLQNLLPIDGLRGPRCTAPPLTALLQLLEDHYLRSKVILECFRARFFIGETRFYCRAKDWRNENR